MNSERSIVVKFFVAISERLLPAIRYLWIMKCNFSNNENSIYNEEQVMTPVVRSASVFAETTRLIAMYQES